MKAFGKQVVVAAKDSGKQAGLGDDDDQTFVEAVNWHAVQGKRFKAGLAFLRHPSMPLETTVLAISVEPVRYITRWLMKQCPRQQLPNRMPPLITLASGVESPLVSVLQYISGLLAGEGGRRCLLVEDGGCDSVTEWVALNAHCAKVLRRILMVTVASLHRRLDFDSQAYPWKLAALADDRVDVEDRANVATNFLRAKTCCLDRWFSYRLREHVQGLPDLMQADRRTGRVSGLSNSSVEPMSN